MLLQMSFVDDFIIALRMKEGNNFFALDKINSDRCWNLGSPCEAKAARKFLKMGSTLSQIRHFVY